MNVRTCALIYGLAFTGVGIAGFIPGFVTAHCSACWLAVYRNPYAAVGYVRVVAVVYVLFMLTVAAYFGFVRPAQPHRAEEPAARST